METFSVSFTFQLTTSRKGRHIETGRIRHMIVFQLTTSRKGRLTPTAFWNAVEIFQLTTSRKGRRLADGDTVIDKTFQLTTSRKGRQQFVTKSMDINHRFHNKSHNKSLFFALIILCLSIFH